MKLTILSIILFTSILLSTLTGIAAAAEDTPSNQAENLTVGALLPLSGELSSTGVSDIAALNLAEEDINKFPSRASREAHINLIMKDTGTLPNTTLADLKDLQAQGVKIIIGPEDSASLSRVMDYADKNHIILISPTSTAPSLAISNDTTFRLMPDDRRLGAAVAALMSSDGIQVMVPMGRKDVWADGLINATSTAFSAKGGTVMDDVRYSPGTDNFSAEIGLLRNQLDDALSRYGPKSVAVYLVSFEEGAAIMSLAMDDPVLSSVKWYGGDSSAVTFSENPKAAKFAQATKFVYPRYGDERSEIFIRLRERLGKDPDAESVNAYDALWLITETYLMTGSDEPELFKSTLPEVAKSRMGSYGSLALNQAGDRDFASYTFMTLESINGTLQWVPAARYTSSSGQGEHLIPAEAPEVQPSLKVLVVNSYHSGWALEDDLVLGIKEGLEREGFVYGKDYALKVFWMDTKVNHTTPEEIKAQGKQALGIIGDWKPDIVFVNNDNALDYAAVAYAEKNPESRLPFVFAGTNIDPSIYKPVGSLEHPAGTITGTLERIPFGTAFAEARKILPNATRILLLSDASPSSVDAKKEFEAWYALHRNDSALKVVDFIQTNDFEQWKGTVEDYQNRTDMMGFIGYQQIMDRDGKVVPAVDVAKWTVEHNRLPELDLVPSDAKYGMLMGAGISYWRTGMYGGIVGGQILNGKSPNQFPIVDPNVVELTFNRNRAKNLNMTIPVDSLVRADAVYE